MKKASPWIVILGILAIIVLWVANAYNGFVAAEEEVESAWSQVENQYQRRADLVPNLVATVKGYAAHEQETLEGVVEARAKATQIIIDPETATPEQLAAFQAARPQVQVQQLPYLLRTHHKICFLQVIRFHTLDRSYSSPLLFSELLPDLLFSSALKAELGSGP